MKNILLINLLNLTYSNITNFNNTTTKGSGLSTGIGTSADNFFKGTSPNGTTTITNINEGQEKEGTTKATIGKGNITIAGNEVSKTNNNLDLIRDLNRDTNNTQQITKDMITGALNNTLEIDNRVFTIDGWKSVYGDVVNTPMNAWNATKGALKDTKLTLDISSDLLGAIPLSPVWVSRKLTEMTGIPPHPLPSFGIGDEVMGQATIKRDKNNKPDPVDKNGNKIIYQETGNGGFKSDNNLLFKTLYTVLPGGKAATDQHDILMNKYGIDSNLGLAGTILPSFAATYYGVVGTILDTKNYSSNASKIKESYNNSVPNGSIVINNQTGSIKVKFNPDPNFNYKDINVIRGKR